MPEDEIQDKSRSTFLKAMIVLSAGAAVAGVLKEGLSNLVTPSVGLISEVGNAAVLFQAVPFMIPILFLAFVELFASIRAGYFEPLDSYSVALISSQYLQTM